MLLHAPCEHACTHTRILAHSAWCANARTALARSTGSAGGWSVQANVGWQNASAQQCARQLSVGCQVNATTFQEWRAYMKKLDSLEGAAPARNRRCSVPRLQRATANRQACVLRDTIHTCTSEAMLRNAAALRHSAALNQRYLLAQWRTYTCDGASILRSGANCERARSVERRGAGGRKD
jgi:hypothetical protein